MLGRRKVILVAIVISLGMSCREKKKENVQIENLSIGYIAKEIDLTDVDRSPRTLTESFVFSLIKRGLVRQSSGGGIVSDIAKSWSIHEDFKVFKFDLEMECTDVVNSIELKIKKSEYVVPYFRKISLMKCDSNNVLVVTFLKPEKNFLTEISRTYYSIEVHNTSGKIEKLGHYEVIGQVSGKEVLKLKDKFKGSDYPSFLHLKSYRGMDELFQAFKRNEVNFIFKVVNDSELFDHHGVSRKNILFSDVHTRLILAVPGLVKRKQSLAVNRCILFHFDRMKTLRTDKYLQDNLNAAYGVNPPHYEKHLKSLSEYGKVPRLKDCAKYKEIVLSFSSENISISLVQKISKEMSRLGVKNSIVDISHGDLTSRLNSGQYEVMLLSFGLNTNADLNARSFYERGNIFKPTSYNGIQEMIKEGEEFPLLKQIAISERGLLTPLFFERSTSLISDCFILKKENFLQVNGVTLIRDLNCR